MLWMISMRALLANERVVMASVWVENVMKFENEGATVQYSDLLRLHTS